MDLLALIVMFWVFLAWMNELFKKSPKPDPEEKFGKDLTTYIRYVAKEGEWCD